MMSKSPAPMPMHIAVWIPLLVLYLRKAGVNEKSVLSKAGIDPRSLKGEDVRLPFDKIASVFETAADASGDDRFGFHFGQTLKARDAGMIGYVGLSSPTLLDALVNLERYRRVFSDSVEIDTSDLHDKGDFYWTFVAPAKVMRRQFQEFSVTNLFNVFRQVTGMNLKPELVAFPHPRSGDLRDYKRFFGGDVEFGAKRPRIRFKLRDLDLPLRTSDDRLLGILQEHCRTVMESREPEQTSLLQQVARLIVDRLTADQAKLDVVASELGMSSRTLTRRLGAEGVTFNGLVDDLRHQLALTYLKDRGLSLTEIAYLLGYAEVSSFNHAFKRWTGATPSKVRAPSS